MAKDNALQEVHGEVQHSGAVMTRQFLEVLSGPARQLYTEGSGRLELAQAIALPDNLITARVLVNRVQASAELKNSAK